MPVKNLEIGTIFPLNQEEDSATVRNIMQACDLLKDSNHQSKNRTIDPKLH